jgi:uncharacterized protein DUF935
MFASSALVITPIIVSTGTRDGGGCVTSPNAPTREIGYAQTPIMSTTGVSSGQWWMFEDETTPELRWPQSVFVYDQMRRQDSQVVSVLRAVTLPVRRTPWRIDPAGARDEVVQLVAEDLGLPIVGRDPKPLARTKDRFSWPDHLREALLMLPFGHMYFEQTYRIVEGLARLRKLGARMPKTIEQIDVARDGGLIAIRQYGIGGGYDQPPIPVNRLVAYVHEKEAGNWLGFSLLRPAYKNWLLKDRLLRVQAQTIERNGMGIPTYEAAETEQDLSKGLGLATSLRAGEAAGAAIPNGAKLRLMGVEGELPDAEPAIRYHDEQIGRAVLAHFLNLGTQTGSWALGSTFADFFTLSLQTLAMQIADVATQHIVEDLVDLNFGEGEPAPKIVFDEIGSRQAATAEAIRALVDAGVITPDEVLERAVRQQFGLPSKDPDAEPVAAQEPEGAELYASAGPPARPKEVTAKFDPHQPRDPGGEDGGQWVHMPGGGGGRNPLDKLRLAGRIPLADGESLVGSSVYTTANSGIVPMALTRGPGGPRLRIATGVSDEDKKRWAGRNLGATANLDQQGIRQLRGVLDEMHTSGDEGGKRFRAIEDRETELDQQRRDILKRQFANLSKTQARRLDQIDRKIEALDHSISYEQEGLRNSREWLERNDPAGGLRWDEIDAEIAALDPDDDADARHIDRLQREQARLVPSYPLRRMRAIREMRKEIEGWQAERDELTANPTPLSPGDQAELAAVDAEIARNNTERVGISESTLLEGTIPGEWADLVYEVTTHEMTYEYDNMGITYRIGARPKDADDDWDLSEDNGATEFEPKELAKLAKMLDDLMGNRSKSSSTRDVQASSKTGHWVQAHLPGLDDSDLDDEPVGELDDDTLILLQAMHELDVERGAVQAAGFNPELHKRWPPGHPKAGKFRPMVDILKLAIAKHDGVGHPFQNFKREQLRNAAKTRGIALSRGEGRDSIAKKLLVDLGGKSSTSREPAAKKTAAPAKKAAKKAAKRAAPRAADPGLPGVTVRRVPQVFPVAPDAFEVTLNGTVVGHIHGNEADPDYGWVPFVPSGASWNMNDPGSKPSREAAIRELTDSYNARPGAAAPSPATSAPARRRSRAAPAASPAGVARTATRSDEIRAAADRIDEAVRDNPGWRGVAAAREVAREQINAVDRLLGDRAELRSDLGSIRGLNLHSSQQALVADRLRDIADRLDAPTPTPTSPDDPQGELIGSLIPSSYNDSVARDSAIRRVIQERLNGEYAGLTVRVASVDATTDEIDFSANIMDANGRDVGTTQRILRRGRDGKLWVYHAYLSLNRDVQGQGFAEAWNSHLMSWYSESGLDRVEVTANIDVGGYTWARQGFDWKDRFAADSIAGRLQRQIAGASAGPYAGTNAGRYSADQVAAAQSIIDRMGRARFGDPDFPTAYEVSQVGRLPGQGRTDSWPGKDAMLGSTWSGVKPVPAAGAVPVS